MNREITEYEDRWLLRPLRHSHVTHIEWGPDNLELVLDSPFRIVAGYGAELSPRSLARNDPDRHVITHWATTEVEKILSAPILSAVFFKSGSLRLGFQNGWNMFVSNRYPDASVTIYSNDTLLLDRSGIVDQAKFPVVQIDPWTGNQITAPPWPPKPADLHIDYDSDDINS